ncbi:hypothetical protein KKE45_04135 [Patescibacteria group bacterium]|nr:hypothetical protein [Patescibacteria group bacterium]
MDATKKEFSKVMDIDGLPSAVTGKDNFLYEPLSTIKMNITPADLSDPLFSRTNPKGTGERQ